MKLETDVVVMLPESRTSTALNLPGPRQVKLRDGIPDPVVGRFGKCEVEQSAGKLLCFLQTQSREWEPFKFSDLAAYYEQQGWNPDAAFFGLTGLWWDDGMMTNGYRETDPRVICLGDKWAVTNLFIEGCMRP